MKDLDGAADESRDEMSLLKPAWIWDEIKLLHDDRSRDVHLMFA